MGKYADKEIEKYLAVPDDYLSKVINMLCDNDEKGVVVVDNDRPVGVFTRQDMVKCAHCLDQSNLIIRDFMNNNFSMCIGQADSNAINSVHTLFPIVDTDGKLINIFFPGNKKASHHECPVVINAGGKGTRLFPYTKDVPKPMVDVLKGKKMLDIVMDQFHDNGFNDFNVIINHQKEVIKNYYKDKKTDYNLSFVEEEKPLGSGGGLYFYKDKIKQTFWLSNCDIVLLESIDEIYEFHKESNQLATMVVSLNPIKVPYGVVKVDENQRIISTIEKPTYLPLVNVGVYILEPEIFNYVNKDENIGFPDILERAQKNGERIGIYPITSDRWLDMGQIKELEYARERLSKILEQNT